MPGTARTRASKVAVRASGSSAGVHSATFTDVRPAAAAAAGAAQATAAGRSRRARRRIVPS